MAAETKVIYYVDGQETPYLVKVPVAADEVTLGDLKTVLKKYNYRYFFKADYAAIGVVKEEVTDDASRLPLYNNKVVCYLVELSPGSVVSSVAGHLPNSRSAGPHVTAASESSVGSDSMVSDLPQGLERGPGVGETRPPSFQ